VKQRGKRRNPNPKQGILSPEQIRLLDELNFEVSGDIALFFPLLQLFLKSFVFSKKQWERPQGISKSMDRKFVMVPILPPPPTRSKGSYSRAVAKKDD
jgi:hypothetical protein